MASHTDPEPDDPYDWTIDDVVEQFCRNPRPIWSPEKPVQMFSDPILFEKAFRDNHINGETLLEIDNQALRDDIGITSFGQRNAIVKAVRFLRYKSRKWQQPPFQAEALARFASSGALATPQMTYSHMSAFPHSPVYRGQAFSPTMQPQHALGSPAFNDRFEFPRQSTPTGHPNPLRRTPTISRPMPSHAPTGYESKEGQARTMVDQSLEESAQGEIYNELRPPVAAPLVEREQETAIHRTRVASLQVSDNQTPLLNALEAGLDKTLLNSGVDFGKDVDNRSPHPPPDRRTPDNQLSHVKAQRRIAPTFVSHNPEERAKDYRFYQVDDAHNPSQELAGNGSYLFQDGMPIETIFYSGATDAGRDFEFVSYKQPTGTRKSVAKIMTNFLKQPIQTLPNSETKYRIPYKKSLLLSDNDSQYFTMFAPELAPAVRNIEDWPGLQLSQNMGRRRASRLLTISRQEKAPIENANPFSVPEIKPQEATDYDYLLAKYPPAEDSEAEGLPVYGDSGDEGEYDEETWDEIQKGLEEDRRTKHQGHLSKEDVGKAIDDAIDEQRAVWRTTRCIKVQAKAHRLWLRATREHRRQAEMDMASFWINRFNRAINNIREAILKDNWSSPSEVKHQCQSFEESVFQREESRYLVQILNETCPPSKPTQADLSKVKRLEYADLPPGEEILESDTDISVDNFIVEGFSDAEDIPHDAPNAEIDKSFPRRKAEFESAPERAHSLQASRRTQEESSSDDNASLTSGKAEPPLSVNEQVPATPDLADVDSDTDEERVISSTYRRRVAEQMRQAKAERRETTPSRVPALEERLSNNVSQTDSEPGQDSDLDTPPPLPTTKYRRHGNSKSQAIDLTFSSSPPRADGNQAESSTDFDVRTPDLNPSDEDNPLPKFKLKVNESEMSSPGTKKPTHRVNLQVNPDSDWKNVETIRHVDWDTIAAGSDHRRALAKAVYEMALADVHKLKAKLKNLEHDMGQGRVFLQNGLFHLAETDRSKKLATNPKQILALLFVTYVNYSDLMDPAEIADSEIDDAFNDLDRLHRSFFVTLDSVVESYIVMCSTPKKRGKKRKNYESDLADSSRDDFDLHMQGPDSEESELPETGEPSGHKKRKRAVAESQEAKSLQTNDKFRVLEEEKRKAVMKERLEALTVTNDNPTAHIINTMEPYIYLDQHIGQRVKPHQLIGISFMWREIIADPKHQGCLLAHTMGLGKTMQVISLLYTIAQAGHSEIEDIKNQIPESMREICALVICPPALLDNWRDEFMMWIPDNNTVLGKVRKIDQTVKDRQGQIQKWATEGGVLLLGYDMLRRFIRNTGGKFTPHDHAQIEGHLLNSPNIVVADEAHKMKNASSNIAKVAKRFRTLSRIALTGSPLNNHLEEYHTMVDWIASGYLGNLVQFKTKYSEPIMDGLYADSSPYERRVAMKKLHVLKRDLDPKINRADISAVEKDMPSKTEFFITIPLTELQVEAYNVFVSSILQGNLSGGGQNAKLWAWSSVLGLLCNHPSCFVQKLMYRTSGPEPTVKEKSRNTSEDDESSVLPEDVSTAELDISNHMMNKAVQVFEDVMQNNLLQEVDLSYRSAIVHRILQESVRVGDKVLVFSHSIPTLNYLQSMLERSKWSFARIDGGTKVSDRQDITKNFNLNVGGEQIFLISMKAGGLGLNLQGANRVIIFDFSWNPTWEEQAIGRAYRLGQKKPVFVYRFRTGGTFENVLYNKAVFKTQLFQRVVDKKNYKGMATKSVSDYIFPAEDVEQHDFSENVGKDPEVLDRIIKRVKCIRNIELTETFQREEEQDLSPEEKRAADQEYENERLMRDDPAEYNRRQQQKQQAYLQQQAQFQQIPSVPARPTPYVPKTPARSPQHQASYPGLPAAEILHGSSKGAPTFDDRTETTVATPLINGQIQDANDMDVVNNGPEKENMSGTDLMPAGRQPQPYSYSYSNSTKSSSPWPTQRRESVNSIKENNSAQQSRRTSSEDPAPQYQANSHDGAMDEPDPDNHMSGSNEDGCKAQ